MFLLIKYNFFMILDVLKIQICYSKVVLVNFKNPNQNL